MEHRSSSSSIEKARLETKANFLLRLRANSGYKRLTKIRGFDSGRRNRLEEACWRHHYFAVRKWALWCTRKASALTFYGAASHSRRSLLDTPDGRYIA